jgi:hypothetical protein
LVTSNPRIVKQPKAMNFKHSSFLRPPKCIENFNFDIITIPPLEVRTSTKYIHGHQYKCFKSLTETKNWGDKTQKWSKGSRQDCGNMRRTEF